MNFIIRVYKLIAAHCGKILSTIGATFIGLDIAGMADQLKMFAGQYLGEKAAQKFGVALFILLFLRTTYTGIKAKQVQP